MIKGPNKYTLSQINDAVRDGLRAVRNTIVDGSILAGAGAFEAACYHHLMKVASKLKGRDKLGVQAYAEALLVIPKTLAQNSGLDPQESKITLLEESKEGTKVGIDLKTGGVILPLDEGIYDNYQVKKQFLHLPALIASKLLLVD